MPEILTESFCERCGTRYTFESARSKVRLKGVKVLSRGLKNFVLSDDTTMDEAMAAARSEADREVTAHQLDAFHKTFSFCMSCRQYTCPNCWNEVEARCQSCAPLPEPEFAPRLAEPVAFPGVLGLAETTAIAESASNGANGQDHDGVAADDAAALAAAGPAVAPPEPEAIAAAAEPVAPEPEAIAEPPAAEVVNAEPAAKASSQTAGLLHRFRPGQSLDDELDAFDRERSDVEAREPEPQAAEAFDRGAETAAEVVAEESAVETVAAEAPVQAGADIEEPVGAAQAEPEPAAPSAADVVEQPTWRITAPDLEAPAVGAPAQGEAVSPIRVAEPTLPPAEPQWPAKPEWPARQPSIGLPFLGRPAEPQGGVDALWAASNRELVATPPTPGRSTSGIQPCISCGLSLSANARFCRRCGTLQGG